MTTLDEQRRRARRLAVLLGVLALSFYLGFIIIQGMRG